MNAFSHYVKDLNGLEEEGLISDFLSRFTVEKQIIYSKFVLVKLLFTEIYDCCCILSFQISAGSLLFQLLEQKMGNGLFADNSCQYASLVVMV